VIHVPDGFRINRRGIDKFTKALDKELQRSAKRNIKPVPVATDSASGAARSRATMVPPAQPTQIVNGPTFYGDIHGQLAWDNTGPVHQHQAVQPIAGSEDLARLAELAHALLEQLATAAVPTTRGERRPDQPDVIDETDGTVDDAVIAEARAAAAALWAEAQQVELDRGRIATAVARMRTALPGLASGIISSSLVTAIAQLPW